MDPPEAEHKLGDLVYAEIKKAFSICDQDGNGQLDRSEVRNVMKSILEQEPTEEELQKFMNMVDSDKSGAVSFPEFLTAITAWLQEDSKDHISPVKEDNSRKRKLVHTERHEVHKKIKGFFKQFQQSPQFDDVRKRMGHIATPADAMQLDETPEQTSNANKMKFLEQFRKNIETDPNNISLALKTGQLENMLPAIRKLYELLRIVEVFNTPAQRRSIAEDVVRIYSFAAEQGIVEPIVKCLHFQHPELQSLALNALRLLAPGPNIASTPHDHILHPDKMLFKRLIYTQNPFPILVAFLSGTNEKLCEDAINFVIVFSQNHPECRDVVLQSGALTPILAMASLGHNRQQASPNAQSAAELIKVVRAMVVLLGVSQPITKLPQWNYISSALPAIGSLLFSNDENILLPVLTAASFLLPGVPELFVCRRLIEIITSHPSVRAQKTALKTIDNIIRYDPIQTHDVLIAQCHLVEALRTLIDKGDVALRANACETLALVAHTNGKALIDNHLVPHLLAKIHNDDYIRPQLVKVVKNIASGPQNQVEYLVNHNVVSAMCKAFSFFKAYDEVLVKEYKYAGATYNFDLANAIIGVLEIIVNTGEAAVAAKSEAINPYALVFDLECIDKIRTFLGTIKDSLQHYGGLVDAWREKGINKPANSTEERMKRLLHVIYKAHKAKAETQSDNTSVAIVKLLDEIGKDFYVPATPVEKILLKCGYNGDMRIISIDSDITYPKFKALLEEKYEITRSSIAYTDEEKDKITIDSKEALQKAFAKYKTDGATALKLDISVAPPTPQISARRGSLSAPGSLHAALSPPLSPPTPYPKLSPLITPLDLDAISMDLHHLEVIRAQERKVLLESLATTTHFGVKELDTMHTNWAAQSPSGYLTKEQFAAGLAHVGVTDPLVVESYWHAFDMNRDGKVNFRQFVTGLGILKRGSLPEKLQFAFRAYDKDNSEFIEKPELMDMIRAGTMAQNRVMTNNELVQAVEECFRVMDVNKDGKLSYDEFSHAIMLQPALVKLFVPSIPGLM